MKRQLNRLQRSRRLHVSALLLAVLSLVGCTSPTIQGQIEDWGLQNFVRKVDPDEYKSALLTSLMLTTSGWRYSKNVRERFERSSFTRGEEEVAQQAMNSDKQNIATTWTNKRYGEVKFLPGERYQKDGKECRRFSLEWIFHGGGITKQTERGRACINERTGRWEWV